MKPRCPVPGWNLRFTFLSMTKVVVTGRDAVGRGKPGSKVHVLS
jgi:hypothetical protein